MDDVSQNINQLHVEDFNFDEGIPTQWGGIIVPAKDEWFLNNDSIKFKHYRLVVTDSFVNRLKIVLAYRAMRFTYSTVKGEFNRLLAFIRFLASSGRKNIDVISEEQIVLWHSELTKLSKTYELGALRGLLLASRIFLEAPLIQDAAADHLLQLRLPGSPKGSKVNDPDGGRMTLAERDILETKARQAYEKEVIGTQEFLVLILFNTFGLRLIDFSGLKVKDVNIGKATIDIPCGKSGELPRSRMSYGNQLDPCVASLFNEITPGRSGEAPLFVIEGSNARTQEGVFDGHMTENSWSDYLQRVIKKLELGFHLNAYRFRYTVGTEAYRETGNPYVAAQVLRHSDIQNVKVYVNEIVLAEAHDKVVSEVFKDVDAVIAAGVKAKTFCGKIIAEQNYKEGRLYAVRAREQTGNFDPIGGCAGKKECAMGIPISCYCCASFRPIEEADHYGMLCATLSEYFAIVEDDPKRATSLVSAILGMAQVCYLTGQGFGRKSRYN